MFSILLRHPTSDARQTKFFEDVTQTFTPNLRNLLAEFGYDDEAKIISAPPPIEIVKLVANEHKVEVDKLLKGGASKERNIAISLIRSQTGLKLKEVAGMFDITHTAVSKAVNKLEAEATADKTLKERLDRLIHKLVTVPSL